MAEGRQATRRTAWWIAGGLLLAATAVLLLRGGEVVGDDEGADVLPTALAVEQALRHGGLVINHFPAARTVDEAARGIGLSSRAIAGTDAAELEIHAYETPEARELSQGRAREWCSACDYIVGCGTVSVSLTGRPGTDGQTLRREAELAAAVLGEHFSGCRALPLDPGREPEMGAGGRRSVAPLPASG